MNRHFLTRKGEATSSRNTMAPKAQTVCMSSHGQTARNSLLQGWPRAHVPGKGWRRARRPREIQQEPGSHCPATPKASCLKLDGKVHVNSAGQVTLVPLLKVMSCGVVLLLNYRVSTSLWS